METGKPQHAKSDPAGRFLRTDHLQRDLKRRSVRGGAATLAAQFIKQFVIGLAATAILARLLRPEDFGLIAMVGGLTNLLAQFKDLGLSMATVQRKELTQAQVSTLFWLNVGLGLAVATIAGAMAPVVAWFYGEPRLTAITVAMAAAFLFSGTAVQHQALMLRQMRFTLLAKVRVASAAVGALAGVTAAWQGAGYWSLVVMQLTGTVTVSALLWTVCGWRPGRPARGAGVGSLLAFGGNLTAANLLNYLVRNLDNILIGWRWGAGPLGLYAKAYGLLMLPIRQFNTPLTNVAIPALSQLQDRPALYVDFYKRGIQLLTMVGMPLVVFTFVDAREVILLVLGPQWLEAVPIFRVLAPAAFIGTFNVATGWVYISLGRTRRQLRWTMIGALFNITAFIIGLRWGAVGVATAYSISACAIRFPGLCFCFHGTIVGMRDLGSAIWRSVGASALAGVALSVSGAVFVPPVGAGLRITIDLIAFVAAYTAAWYVLPGGRGVMRDSLALLNELRQPDRANPSCPG
ncbi:MAG: lipopolysaccharide biosynthesis protein [Phycisphaerae bacterium]